MSADDATRMNRFALVTGLIVTLALIVLFASRTGPGQPTALPGLLWTILTAGPLALTWLLAAYGYGIIATAAIDPDGAFTCDLRWPIGIALLLVIDATLGPLGLLGFPVTAFALTPCLAVLYKAIRAKDLTSTLGSIHWTTWLAGPAIAILIVASCSAPGWLWESEFGGYDALSYHLQGPAEWLAIGRMEPLTHNVYTALPGYMEAAFVHLMVLQGDAVAAATACQLLHAGIAIAAAWVTFRLAGQLVSPAHSNIAGLAILATPWVIVVGSLAYNEAPVLLCLAAGILTLIQPRMPHVHRGMLLGLFAGVACASKLTAVGLVAAPLALLALLFIKPRHWLVVSGVGLTTFALALAPWLIRNAVHVGNPVFPFLTGLFGNAHWTPEQCVIWATGHASDASPIERLLALWNQYFRQGIGPNPDPVEPWLPQWMLMPWLGVAGLIICALRSECRKSVAIPTIILTTQLAFWLAFTHLQSRFLVPTVVPLALGISMLAHSLPRNWKALMTVVIALSMLGPVYVFWQQRDGAPAAMIDAESLMTGDGLPPDQRRAFAVEASPDVFLNHLLKNQRVLLVGNARPFYITCEFSYTTTWDRGPFNDVVASSTNDRTQAFDTLRESGFTHVMIDASMLRRWQEAGWNDPHLDAVTALNACRDLRPVHVWPSLDVHLFEIPGPQP